jgi:hypothetical protein
LAKQQNGFFDTYIKKLFLTLVNSPRPLPRAFQNSLLRNVRTVIDCTEIFTESPMYYRQAGNMYSSYKSPATSKVLIGVAPSGACMYVSEVYEGSISDREIVKQSDFISCLATGDVVLADRGLKIHDLCAERDATLVIPPFLAGRKQFTKEETLQTKLIARSRIHVERFNERLKKFRIMSGIVPLKLVPLLSQIVFVACCMVNFQPPLVK